MRRVFGAAVLIVAGCSAAPRVDPFWVRAEATGALAFPPAGFTRAREDPEEGALEGDEVDLRQDLGVDGSIAYGADLEARPFFGNDDVKLTYFKLGELRGGETLERSRRFDGRTYAAGERVDSELAWERMSVSLAHRVYAFPGASGTRADVLVRAGVERDVFDTEIEGSVTPKESRQLRAGAPFAGVEGRIAVADGVVVRVGASGGYWNHEGAKLACADAGVGARWNIAGPLDLGLDYDFAFQNAVASFENGELSATELRVHLVSVALGLHF